jgi:hypothetical protein
MANDDQADELARWARCTLGGRWIRFRPISDGRMRVEVSWLSARTAERLAPAGFTRDDGGTCMADVPTAKLYDCLVAVAEVVGRRR